MFPQLDFASTKKFAKGQFILGHSSDVGSTSPTPHITIMSISKLTVDPPSKSSKFPSPSASTSPEPGIMGKLSKLIERSSPIQV